MLISIIVPVYNAEQFISFCLESIIRQTYKKIEILVVDDGSTDKSLNICMDYAKRDSRIVIIQESHKGLVTARKRGIEKAKGEYCMFVDSDDWISDRLIKAIYPLIDENNADVVNYNMKSVKNYKYMGWKYTIQAGTYEGRQLEDIYKKMMFDFENGCPGIIQSLCTKLIKRDILQSCIENMDSRITMGEDAALTYHVLLEAKKIVVTNDYLYFYRVHQRSMCNVVDTEIFTKLYYFQKYMQNVFSGYSKEYELDRQLQAYLLQFIKKGMADMFSIKMNNSYHVPFQLPKIGKRVVLYGAGGVGKSYYKQLIQDTDIKIVAWIDKALQNKKIYNCEIKAIESLDNIEFDRILIAVKDENVAKDIEGQLSEYVAEEQILWKKPISNWWEKEFDI